MDIFSSYSRKYQDIKDKHIYTYSRTKKEKLALSCLELIF